jgi:predicted dehydrogenase
MDGGVINQQAIHHVDALNWIVGPVSRVCASMANRVNNLEAEDTLVAAIEFQNGALGTIEATTALRPHDVEASLSIVGDAGVVVVGGVALNKIETWKFLNANPGDNLTIEKYSVSVPNGYGLSHGSFLQQVFDHLVFGGNVMVQAQDGLTTTSLIHALYASIENNCWIDVASNVTSTKLGVMNVGE